MIFISIDGDDIGQVLTSLIYTKNNEKLIAEFSKDVENSFKRIERWAKENDGHCLIPTLTDTES